MGKSTKAAPLQLCAPVTKVRKRGGRPQPPASEKPGITATLTERSQDPTLPPGEWVVEIAALYMNCPILLTPTVLYVCIHLLQAAINPFI